MSVGPTCCDFLSSANVSARSSLGVSDGRGHMPRPDHHAVTLTVADARRWMQRRKINSRVIRAAGAWPRARSAFLNPGILAPSTGTWHCALFRPDRFPALATLSVPFRPRSPARPTSLMPKTDTAQFYQLYFQEPGEAEAEFERNVERTVRLTLFGASGDAPADNSGQGAMVPTGGRPGKS